MFSIRKKKIQPIEITKFFYIILSLFIVLAFFAASTKVQANEDSEELAFSEAHIFFELNNTDGDLGIHALIDGDPWKRLEIEDPNERRMLLVKVKGRLRKQGLTEFFFESAEPTFDELAPEQFFQRFPEGTYEIEGITLEGDEMEGEIELSHVMPAPPDIYFIVDNTYIPAAEDCDAEELPEFTVGDPIVIFWEQVVTSHPELGKQGDVEVNNYEVVIEIDDTPWKTSTILPPDATSFMVPPEILDILEFDEEGEAEVKFEVLVRAMNYNQTAVESCFVVILPE